MPGLAPGSTADSLNGQLGHKEPLECSFLASMKTAYSANVLVDPLGCLGVWRKKGSSLEKPTRVFFPHESEIQLPKCVCVLQLLTDRCQDPKYVFLSQEFRR